jgi:hypothetical protein
MIDVNDGEAACLAREGEVLPAPIVESESRAGIAWQARHRFDGEDFTVLEPDGSAQTHRGFPVALIRSVIAEYAVECSRAKAANVSIASDRLKHTGRNDPCPCGSGRKFKHCCLYDAASGLEAAVLTWLKAGNRQHKDWANTTLERQRDVHRLRPPDRGEAS